jgi:hypothetical protein
MSGFSAGYLPFMLLEVRSGCRIDMDLLKSSQKRRTREEILHIICFKCVLCSFAYLICLGAYAAQDCCKDKSQCLVRNDFSLYSVKYLP